MNSIRCLATAVVLVALGGLAVANQETARPGVWEVQFDNGAIVDLRLLCEGAKVVAGFALETDRNVPWLADTKRLTVSTDGRLTGKLVLTPGPDLVAAVTARNGRKPPPPPKAEELTLDIAAKDGRVSGTLTTVRKVNNGLLGHNSDSVKVRGRILPNTPAADAQFEFMLLGVGSTGAEGLYAVGAAFYVRLHLRGGKVQAGKLSPVFHQKATPIDLVVPADEVLVVGNKVKGRIPIKFQPARKAPTLGGFISLDGVVIGDLVAGTARWEGKGQDAADTCFRGRGSRAKALTSLDTSARTWPPQGKPLEADPKLVARAREETLQPLFPGELGKHEFYSTRPIRSLCSALMTRIIHFR